MHYFSLYILAYYYTLHFTLYFKMDHNTLQSNTLFLLICCVILTWALSIFYNYLFTQDSFTSKREMRKNVYGTYSTYNEDLDMNNDSLLNRYLDT